MREGKVINVILSGGVGSRLWPLSRKLRPKQYLNIFQGNKSLFELTLGRNKDLCESFLIVGNESNISLSKKVLNKYKVDSDVIVETVPRNTAAAIAFAAFSQKPEDILLVTPADHIIEDLKEYRRTLQDGISLASEGNIVTFGIEPDRPETGYGYIEHKGNQVIQFHEKPTKKSALSFLRKGTFLWNSGIFCFKVSIFLKELKQYAPQVYKESLATWNHSDLGLLDEQRSLKIPSISVDYAVMEKSKKMKVIPSHFNWNDMGSFGALYNYLKNEGHPIDEKGNMNISHGTRQTINTFFIGLENCISVTTEDVHLILCEKDSQNVKKLYKTLEQEKSKLL